MSAIIIPFPVRPAPDSSAADCGAEARISRHTVTARFGADGLLDQPEYEWFCQAEHVLDQVEARLDDSVGRPGATREVTALCEQAVWCLLDAAPEIDDRDAVMALLDRLRDLHLRACTLDPPDAVRLADFVYRLARSEAMGVLHGVIDPYVPLLGAEGLAEIRRLLAVDERRMRTAPGIKRSILEFRLRPIQTSLARADHPSAV